MSDSNLATDVIWPIVTALITATLQEDQVAAQKLLRPRSVSAEMVDLFGLIALDLLLKTILDRDNVALTRVIRARQGKTVYTEYIWPDTEHQSDSVLFTDAVTVVLRPYRHEWRVTDINPSSMDQWLTGPAARALLSNIIEGNEGRMPQETWVLPLAFVGGAVRLAFRPTALQDEVEQLLLPGMQERGYGAMALVSGRRIWRDYVRKAKPEIGRAALWAAAVEYLMSEQALIDTAQAFVGQQYGVPLVQLLPRIRLIRETLGIDGLDDRYSPLRGVNIVTDKSKTPAEVDSSSQATTSA